MLTRKQLIAINYMEPGSVIKMDGLTLVCRASLSYLSGHNCRHCALYNLNCQGIACLKGMPTPRGELRKQDIYFTLYFE